MRPEVLIDAEHLNRAREQPAEFSNAAGDALHRLAEEDPTFQHYRDPETGAVLSDDPARHEAEIAEIRAEQARRDAFVEPVEGVVYPVLEGETHCDAAVPPTVEG